MKKIISFFTVVVVASTFFLGIFLIFNMDHMSDSGHHHACPVANVINMECIGDGDLLAMISAHITSLKHQFVSMAAVGIILLLLVALWKYTTQSFQLDYKTYKTRLFNRFLDVSVTVWRRLLRWIASHNKGDLPYSFWMHAYQR